MNKIMKWALGIIFSVLFVIFIILYFFFFPVCDYSEKKIENKLEGKEIYLIKEVLLLENKSLGSYSLNHYSEKCNPMLYDASKKSLSDGKFSSYSGQGLEEFYYSLGYGNISKINDYKFTLKGVYRSEANGINAWGGRHLYFLILENNGLLYSIQDVELGLTTDEFIFYYLEYGKKVNLSTEDIRK